MRHAEDGINVELVQRLTTDAIRMIPSTCLKPLMIFDLGTLTVHYIAVAHRIQTLRNVVMQRAVISEIACAMKS